MKRKTPKTGFTIIELILVMTIIGVLMSIAVPTYLNVRFRMVEEKARFNLNAIYSAQKSYHWENNSSNYAGPGQQDALLTHVGFSTNDGDWVYAINAASATTFRAQAQNSKDNSLYMYINQNGNITTSY